MVTVKFGVFQIGTQWSLCRADERLQSFTNKLEAMAAAGRAVLTAADSGDDVELHIMDTGGLLRQVAPLWLTR